MLVFMLLILPVHTVSVVDGKNLSFCLLTSKKQSENKCSVNKGQVIHVQPIYRKRLLDTSSSFEQWQDNESTARCFRYQKDETSVQTRTDNFEGG